MKKYILLLSLSGGIFFSCEHEKLSTYSSDNRVYFQQKSDVDSIFFNLKDIEHADEYKEDSVVRVPVLFMGSSADSDRPIGVEIKSESTAKSGADFDVEKAIVPAYDEEAGYIQLKLKNSEPLKEKDTLLIYLKLVDNEFFKADYNIWTTTKDEDKGKKKNSIEYKVYFYSTLNIPPRLWIDFNQYGSSGALTQGMKMWLGEFTPLKYDVFLSATGLKDEYFNYTDDELEAMEGTNTFAKAKKLFETRFGDMRINGRWKSLISLYLAKPENAHIEQITWGTSWGTLN